LVLGIYRVYAGQMVRVGVIQEFFGKRRDRERDLLQLGLAGLGGGTDALQ